MGNSPSRVYLDSDVSPMRITSPLVTAAINGCLYSVKEILVRTEENIEARGTLTIEGEIVEFCSPLFAAAAGGHLDVVKLLIERDADVNARTKTIKLYDYCDDRTPLMMACHGGYLDVASYLIEHGADIDLQDSIQDTCLHYAARMGHVEIVDKLLSVGAEQKQNDIGVKPLFESCVHCRIEVVEYYIKRPDCSKEQRIDALELLGACIAEDNVAYDTEKALTFMERGMDERFV